MPLSIWGWLGVIFGGALGGIFLYHFYNWGQAITKGLEQTSSGLGAMIGSLGMMFTLLPPMMMVMMFGWMMSTMAKIFED